MQSEANRPINAVRLSAPQSDLQSWGNSYRLVGNGWAIINFSRVSIINLGQKSPTRTIPLTLLPGQGQSKLTLFFNHIPSASYFWGKNENFFHQNLQLDTVGADAVCSCMTEVSAGVLHYCLLTWGPGREFLTWLLVTTFLNNNNRGVRTDTKQFLRLC